MKLAVVGVGLIGASFARAARAEGLFQSFVGVDRSEDHCQRAVAAGIVDTAVIDVPEDADAVLLATPIDQLPGWLEQLASHPGLVFDVGSTKAPLVARIEAGAPAPARFVPAHPIAGSERSGPDASRVDLFRDRLLVITPTANTAAADVDRLRGWWSAIGARVVTMDAQAHDQTFALTSHLPHLAAFAYMQLIDAEHLSYAAGGFRDFSRIAASDPDMWTPVLRANRTAVLEALGAYEAKLALLRDAIEADDEAALYGLLCAARDRRRQFEDGVE
ncbi:MAG: prephenate dehydrogenase/arogenate dehydrogenase family protein [Pseudomonadota bacterium]